MNGHATLKTVMQIILQLKQLLDEASDSQGLAVAFE
jgi:hypothetical protein